MAQKDTFEIGKIGEGVFIEFYKDIVARIGYSDKATLEDVRYDPKHQDLTDIDFYVYDRENETLSNADMPNESKHEVKTEGQCFAGKLRGNIYIEGIETIWRYEREINNPNKGSIRGIPCVKYKSNGNYNKTGYTADWFHSVVLMEIGTDERISDAALEAWRHSDKVPEDAVIITNARPEYLIISIQRQRLEQFVEGYLEEALGALELKDKWSLDKKTGKHKITGKGFRLPIERVMSRFMPDTCESIGSSTEYSPNAVGDDNIEKWLAKTKEEIKAGIITHGYMIPRAYATGIFKAQRKDGTEMKLAMYNRVLYGKQHENVYVAPEIRASIENFFGWKKQYPWTCRVCQSMIRGTQWV